MTSIFRTDAGRARMLAWHERFRARLAVPTESRQVDTRFGDTHVLVGGPEHGPPLVLLHGALASSAHALSELCALLERFRVYAVDIVGQSVRSAEVRPSVKNDDYGHWLVDVWDGLGLDAAHVVGVSWGGFVAVRLGAVAPQRVRRLVLLVPAGIVKGPAWAGFTKLGWPTLRYRMAPSPARLDAMLRHLLTTPEGDWRAYLGDAFLDYDMDMRVPALAKPETLRELKAPTFVLGASRDLSFPGERLLARARELFPGLADFHLLEDSYHCPPTTEAFRAWLAQRITRFLTQPDADIATSGAAASALTSA